MPPTGIVFFGHAAVSLFAGVVLICPVDAAASYCSYCMIDT